MVAVARFRNEDISKSLFKNYFLSLNIKKTMTNVALNIAKEDFKIKHGYIGQ